MNLVSVMVSDLQLVLSVPVSDGCDPAVELTESEGARVEEGVLGEPLLGERPTQGERMRRWW